MYPSNLKAEFKEARLVRIQNKIMYSTFMFAGVVLSLLALICFVAASSVK